MTTPRTLFGSERAAWICVAVYTAILYGSMQLSFDFYVSVYDRVGRAAVSFWMNSSFVLIGVVVVLFTIRVYRPEPSGYVALLLIGVGLAFCLHQLEIPAKRFHFLQYSPLTLMLFDALRFRVRERGIWVWTLAAVSLAGLGDETVQWILPDRHFGVIDLFVNAGAGLLTLGFIGFVIGEENYPWPFKPAKAV